MDAYRNIFTSLMKRLHAPIYETRLQELVRLIIPHLREGDNVLDVGCGFGALGQKILTSPMCPPHIAILGLERIKRGNELISVETYEGSEIPYPENSFNVVILADVLHHDKNPHKLIDECARVAKRLLIIKDHKADGFLAEKRISVLDWAANVPYGIECLYKYNTLEEWRDWHNRHNLQIEKELSTMRLYQPFVNILFGGRLQYFAVLRPYGETRS